MEVVEPVLSVDAIILRLFPSKVWEEEMKIVVEEVEGMLKGAALDADGVGMFGSEYEYCDLEGEATLGIGALAVEKEPD